MFIDTERVEIITKETKCHHCTTEKGVYWGWSEKYAMCSDCRRDDNTMTPLSILTSTILLGVVLFGFSGMLSVTYTPTNEHRIAYPGEELGIGVYNGLKDEYIYINGNPYAPYYSGMSFGGYTNITIQNQRMEYNIDTNKEEFNEFRFHVLFGISFTLVTVYIVLFSCLRIKGNANMTRRRINVIQERQKAQTLKLIDDQRESIRRIQNTIENMPCNKPQYICDELTGAGSI